MDLVMKDASGMHPCLKLGYDPIPRYSSTESESVTNIFDW
uniref:Uncharacterized protein n=1 Tax=Rhizophora mucronata TaxID=61149 RepID=A0A2P2PI40_RHIMU